MLAQGRVVPGNSDVLQVQYGDDSGLYVEFYTREVHNERKSLEAGYPVYESIEYVKMIPVGDKTKVIDRPVRLKPEGHVPADNARFPRQWQAFKNQEVQTVDGLPVTEWPAITRSDAASLKALNIHTVEQLASLGENNLTWLGARQMRDKAKNFIEKAKGTADAAQWAVKEKYLQDQITALQNQLQGFKAAGIQEASAPPVRKPGRPKKVKDEQNIPPVDSAGG